MVRHADTQVPNDAARPCDGATFRVGDTIFVVAPSAPLPRHGAHTALVSITIPCPVQLDDAQAESPSQQEEPQEEPPRDPEALPWDATEEDGDGRQRDLPLTRGSELVARGTNLPARANGERLSSIVTVPPPRNAGLRRVQADPAWTDARPERSLWSRLLVPSIILLLLAASITLTVAYQRQTRRDLQAMRTTLGDQQQAMGNAVMEEVRREIRGLPLPSPQQAREQAEANAQAIRELNQTIAERMQSSERQTRQLSDTIRQELSQQQKLLAEQKPLAEQKGVEDNSQKNDAVLKELRELKAALSDLRLRPAPAQAPVTAAAPASTDEAATPPAARAAALDAEQDAAATLARARMSVAAQPAARPAAIYLVDATGELKNMIPEAVAEVRRLIQHQDQPDPPYVLMLYSDRLVRISQVSEPGAAANEDESSSVVDFGPSDLPAAIKIALQARPRTLHLLSDTLGGGAQIADALRALNRQGTRIDVTQFHYRQGQDAMKRIAREHNGIYSFIPAGR